MKKEKFFVKEVLEMSEIVDFIKRNYLKNRTIVTNDIITILDDIENTIGIPVNKLKFPSGSEYSTWTIPPKWTVKEAWLKDNKGNIIASYDHNPLFLNVYSCSFSGEISKEDLLKHTTISEMQPNAYSYNWRHAYDYNLQLKQWGISLPKNIADALSEENYQIHIDIEAEKGDMLVGEVTLEGSSDKCLYFLSDYCHPAQVNDSFSGLAMFMKVMFELGKKTDRIYTYKFLILPETIGSAAYITEFLQNKENIIGAIFSEMVAWGDSWFLKLSRQEDTYMNLLAMNLCRSYAELSTSDFFSLIGNDEYMFDSVQCGIPTLSLQKYPYVQYHTSNDNCDFINEAEMEKACAMILHMIDTLEKDTIYQFKHSVPFWMTKYNLYSDYHFDHSNFKIKLNIIYHLLDGKNSNLQIAECLGLKFSDIYLFLCDLEKNDLVERKTNVFQNKKFTIGVK